MDMVLIFQVLAEGQFFRYDSVTANISKIRLILLFYRRHPLSGENNYSHPNNNDAAAYHGA